MTNDGNDYGEGVAKLHPPTIVTPKPTDARFALAENLKRLMETYQAGFRVGITATELEGQTGVSAKTIRRLRDPYNDHSPNFDNIEAIAGFFKIPTWELLKRRPEVRGSALEGQEILTAERNLNLRSAKRNRAKKSG